MRTLLRKIDKAYFRFRDSWRVLTGKESLDADYERGWKNSYEVTTSRIEAVLRSFDPADFQNNHFKLGYYYAAEQVKKELQ
jgi:hypothetical protein